MQAVTAHVRRSTPADRMLATGTIVAMAMLLAACASLAPRPLPPKVEVEGVRVLVDAAGEPRVRVILGMTNPNAFAVTLSSVEAHLSIAGVAVASASLADPVILPASGSTQVEVEARADFAALRQAIGRVLRQLAAAYEVAGVAVVQDGMRLDFRKRGDLPLGDLLGRIR